jgi:hypothetical protein
VIRFFYEKL